MAIRKKHKPVNTALLHTGQLLKQHLQEQGISAAELGRRMGRGRETISRFFKNPTIQTSILLEISIALHYNFFRQVAHLLPPRYAPRPAR
jgi:plasmid maintenance system antidote protein VapI